MEAQKRVLWIEDSARYELSELAGPVYASHKYFLDLAEDATAATHCLLNFKFDILIVDMRIPPGDDPEWKSIYQKQGRNKEVAHLGLHLLHWLLNPNDGYPRGFGDPPDWVKPEIVAVFTVEGREALNGMLKDLDLTYEQKRANRKDTALLDLIDKVVDKWDKSNQ